MSYAPLSWSIDSKIVGVRDGLGPCFLDKNFYDRHPWYKELFIENNTLTKDWWKLQAIMPDYGGPLIQIPMERLARHTDFIDFANFRRGYLVNDKLREILEKSHLPRHKYFPATFMQVDTEVTGYWWLCYDLEDGHEHVDFTRSEFKNEEYLQEYGRPITINSYEEYMRFFYEKGRAMIATKLHFMPSFDKELDIWGTQFLSANKGYISSRLLLEFERNNITGYQLRKSNCDLIFA